MAWKFSIINLIECDDSIWSKQKIGANSTTFSDQLLIRIHKSISINHLRETRFLCKSQREKERKGCEYSVGICGIYTHNNEKTIGMRQQNYSWYINDHYVIHVKKLCKKCVQKKLEKFKSKCIFVPLNQVTNELETHY